MVSYADDTVVGAGSSVGGRLRRARESSGLSLDDICARTRVPTRHLKAIEDDAFDQLPAAPYSVGFAKAFADAVGLDREEIGRDFRAEKEGYAGAIEAVPSDGPFEGTAGLPESAVRWAFLVLVMLAIGFGLWRTGLIGGDHRTAARPPVASVRPAQSAPAALAPPPSAPAAAAKSERALSDESRPVSKTRDRDETSAKASAEDKPKPARSDRRNEAKAEKSGQSKAEHDDRKAVETAEPAAPDSSSFARELNLRMQHPTGPAPAPIVAPPAPPASPPAASTP